MLGSFIGDLFSDFFDVAGSDHKDSRSDLFVSGLALLGLGAMIGAVAYWPLSGLWAHVDQPVEDSSLRGQRNNYSMAIRLAIPGGIAALVALAMFVYGLLSLVKAAMMRESSDSDYD